MTELSAEQALIEKLDEILLEAVDDFYAETHPINTIRDGIIARFMEAFPELAKERGYVLLGKYDLLVGKPITGLPQVGNFLPEEYQPILGDIPPEPWELTGYSGDRYLTVEGRKTILEDVYLARKARADWKALSPERGAELEQEQEDRRTEE